MHTHALVAFLRALAADNDKAWFDAHRATYTTLREDWTILVAQVLDQLGQTDPQVAHLDAKDCLFRINRDVRFSPNKAPYKTQFSAALTPQGRQINQPVYYFHIDHTGTLLTAAGMYQPDSGQLAAIRAAIDAHPQRLRRLLDAAPFARAFGGLGGDQLKTAPRGYSTDHPAIDLLRFRSFTGGRDVAVAELADDAIPSYIAGQLKAGYPLVEYLRGVLAGVTPAH